MKVTFYQGRKCSTALQIHISQKEMQCCSLLEISHPPPEVHNGLFDYDDSDLLRL
jgi:hypothetical protein